MYPLLAETRQQPRRSYRRAKKRSRKPETPKVFRIDAATLASNIQLQEEKRDFTYSLIALTMKAGIIFIGITTLLKLGVSSHTRISRYSELSSVLNVETYKLSTLKTRFDKFFTLGGDRRLMNEQEQWIAPDRIRIIWR